MFLHIVLFRPKPDISEANQKAMFDALRAASTAIPSIKRFHIGTRVKHGRGYERPMTEDYTYSAVIEFEHLEGLTAYLNHPKHERLAELFYELLEAGLIYDYEMASPANLTR